MPCGLHGVIVRRFYADQCYFKIFMNSDSTLLSEHPTAPGCSNSIPAYTKPTHRPREVWIDSLKGFMMFFVIYGHATADDDIINYIYSFHMPIFFLLSGMLFRFNREKSCLLFIKKKFGSLMLPYFALSLYAAPLREWMERIGEANSQSALDLAEGTLLSNADFGLKMSSNTNWFIPCLFLTTVVSFLIWKAGFGLTRRLNQCFRNAGKKFRAYYQLINRKIPVVDLVIALIFLAVFAVCTLLGLNHGSGGIWHWKVALYATGFYLLGYLIMPMTGTIRSRIFQHRKVLGIIILLLFTAGFLLSYRNGYVSMIHNKYKNLGLYYASAVATCLAWILLFMTSPKSPLRFAAPIRRILTFVGTRTFPYIAFQVPVMKLIRHYVPFFRQSGEIYVLALSLLLFFGLMPLADRINRIIPKQFRLTLIPQEIRSRAVRYLRRILSACSARRIFRILHIRRTVWR